MSGKDVSAFREAFEIVAIDAAYESNLPSGVMAQLSAAISLKRIADSLERREINAGEPDLRTFEDLRA